MGGIGYNDDTIVVGCGIAGSAARAGPTLQWLKRFGISFDFAASYFISTSTTRLTQIGAVELVTGIFSETGKAPGIGLAEALRRAMAARIQAGGFRAHPSYWAPFIIVGEGGKT